MNYSRVREIPETCPIYWEAQQTVDHLKNELKLMLQPDMLKQAMEYIDDLLECVDRCREIAGDLRDMCVERGEKIEELEEQIQNIKE